MNQILIAPKGSIDLPTRKILSENGIILIETDNWQDVRLLEPSQLLSTSHFKADDLIMSAMIAIDKGLGVNETFVKELTRRFKENEANAKIK